MLRKNNSLARQDCNIGYWHTACEYDTAEDMYTSGYLSNTPPYCMLQLKMCYVYSHK